MCEMIDKAVQALFDEMIEQETTQSTTLALQGGRIWIDGDTEVSFDARALVKAVIKSMMEPSREMETWGTAAAEDGVINAGTWDHSARVRDDCAKEVWQAMLKTLLGETTGA
jgi:hypothetical protein